MINISKIWNSKKATYHPLSACDDYTKKFYTVILIAASLVNEDSFEEKMNSVKAICKVINYISDDEDMTQELKLAKVFSASTLKDCIETFKGNEIGKLLLLDGLIITTISDENHHPALDFLMKLASAFEIDEKTITLLINLATVIISQDLTRYNCDIVNNSETYNYYLCDFDFSAFRKILYADKVIELWINEQPNIDKWMKENNSFDTSRIYGWGMACTPRVGFSRPVEIILEFEGKKIDMYSHFDLFDMHSITWDTYTNTYDASFTYSNLKKYEQVIVMTKRTSLGDLAESGKIKLPDAKSLTSFDYLKPIFSALPIGIFTHCLDNKKNCENFFVSNGGEINNDDKWK